MKIVCDGDGHPYTIHMLFIYDYYKIESIVRSSFRISHCFESDDQHKIIYFGQSELPNAQLITGKRSLSSIFPHKFKIIEIYTNIPFSASLISLFKPEINFDFIHPNVLVINRYLLIINKMGFTLFVSMEFDFCKEEIANQRIFSNLIRHRPVLTSNQ